MGGWKDKEGLVTERPVHLKQSRSEKREVQNEGICSDSASRKYLMNVMGLSCSHSNMIGAKGAYVAFSPQEQFFFSDLNEES